MFSKIKKWVFWSVVGFLTISVCWVMSLRFINPPITYLMIQRMAEQRKDGKPRKVEKQWIKYENISDHLKRAAIAGEDAHFMSHWGFDTEAIREAYSKNKSGGALRGGSTISQQTAKNVFLWPSRSWFRKGLETYFTVLIEMFWSKKRILEVYLNVIETGDGIYGVEAASIHHFGVSANKVSRRQSALIIAVLPNPRRWSASQPTAFINRKANTINRYLPHYEIPE